MPYGLLLPFSDLQHILLTGIAYTQAVEIDKYVWLPQGIETKCANLMDQGPYNEAMFQLILIKTMCTSMEPDSF